MQRFISIILLTAAFVAAPQDPELSDSLARELNEILVTARQPATKLIGTSLVSTITGTPLENLGTALDVLPQLPMITLADEAVTVTGKGTPEIFIDGRPMRSTDELIRLRSDNIRTVELDLAPGAMYASTTKAVLKISSRRTFLAGLSLTERAEATARRKWSANNMLDADYHTGPVDIFATATVARNNSLIKGSTVNTLIYRDKPAVAGSSQQKSFPSVNGMVKAGINYSAGEQSFGAYYSYNPERARFSNTGQEWIDGEAPVSRDISTAIRAHTHRGSVYYHNTFAGKYLLHFDGDFKHSTSASDAATTYPAGFTPDVNSSERRRSSLWAGKLYLTFPLAKGNLTAGIQPSYTHTALDFRMLNPEVSAYIPSSLTDARQTSSAAFASWDRTFDKLSLSAGVRYEYADYVFNINGLKSNDMSRTDHYLTPDLALSYSFGNDSQLSLSYKMLTVKPPYAQLTGSLNYVGMHEIEGGNPALKDERMHDVQIFGMWKGFMLQADCTRSIDTYAYVKRIYPSASTLQLLMQPINIDVTALDFYLIWSQKIKSWTPNITLGAHKQWLELYGSRFNRPIFSYYFDNAIALPKGFTLTFNASGLTAGHMHTNRFAATWFILDASITKTFLNKALQVKLSATDILNSRNDDWSMTTCGITVSKRQTYDRRGISLTLTYTLHPRRSPYKGAPASSSELNRL